MGVTVNVQNSQESQRLASKKIIDKAQQVDAAIQSDLDALAAANNAETKQIIGRMLVRQRHIVRLLAKLLD